MSPLLAAALLAASPAAGDPLARLEARLARGEWAALQAELERGAARARGGRRAALLVALGRTLHQASAYHRHDPQGAEAAVMRAVDAAREAGDPATAARARLLEGQLRYGQGFADPPRWDAAQRVLEDARGRAAEVKDPRLEAEAIFYLGLVAQQQGRWDAARPLFEDALARATRAKDPLLASYPERHLAYLDDEQREDLPRAEAGFRRSLALRERAGATVLLPFARVALAELLEKAGRPREALPLLERAMAEGARSGSRRGEALAALGLAAVRGQLGDTKGAREAAARAVEAARAFGDPELAAEAERAAEGAGAGR